MVNLDRQCSQATDGMLAFAQPDGVLLAGTRPEEGELSHYISLTAETEGLVLEYYVPSTDMDLDNAMNLALAVGITAVLAAICFVIWYLRSNVVHPLDALVDAMRRISAGDLSVRADWNPVNLESVSYTHLDVYKRQVQTACRGTDGKPLYFEFANMSVTSAEQLAQMDGWDDASTGNWCATTDVVDGMLTIVNPDLTAEEINTYLGTLDFETLKSMMG